MPQKTIKDEGRRAACAEAWADPGSFATTLVTLFHDQYYDPAVPTSQNCYTWHPGTIALEIRDDFLVELPRPNFDRLMAGITMVTSDGFYRNLPDFVDLCAVLSGALFDPTVLDLPDAAECAWGITEALLLAPPDDDDEAPFAAEILGYVGQVLDREGILDPPDVLRLGARPGDPAARARGEFADDPEMLAAINRKEDEKAREIDNRIRTGLATLVQQLGRLHLIAGDATGLAARFSQPTHER